MTDFFISYTQADRAWAEWIGWVLEAAKHKVKIQAWDFGVGKNFVAEMDTAARAAERTLLVLSPDYLGSRFATAEWSVAFARDPTGEKGLLLPVRVREVELDGLLGPIVYVDLAGLDEAAARERLLVGLARGRSKPVEPPVFPGGRRPRYPADLGDLPADEIPPRGPLPAGSRMPFAANPLFVGRQDDLRALARQLRAGDTSAVGEVEIAATSGLGGIGKTQLACEFVHRYGRFFAGGVFWMSFADPAAVPAEAAACGRSLDLHPSWDSLPLAEQVRRVEEVWSQSIARLLVFDNCEDEALLSQWRPRFGCARVLVTSRRARWDRTLRVETVPLTTLPRPVSVELLRKFRPDILAEELSLSGIAAELGDLPLALHLAGSFLERYTSASSGQPAAYLEALRRGGLLKHPSLQGRFAGLSPTSHEAHVGRTFALSVERLNPADETDALALALLARAAYFAPGEPIPHELLLKTVSYQGDEEAADALGRLTALGLLEPREAGTLVMHRLVAALARESGDGEETKNAVETAIFGEANRQNLTGIPGPLLHWQPHLRVVVEAAAGREDEIAANLCSALDYHLSMVGDFQGARPYSERALAIREKVLGAEHPATAQSLNNLGALLRSQGNLAGAQPYYERALAIREKVLGAHHPDTARSLNNLGLLLRSQGDYAVARPYLERALAVSEKVLGADHPDTARSLNNLGLLLRSQGDLANARPYYERALAIIEKALGADHPDTALSLNNLGALLRSQGDLAGARPYCERALAILEKVLGADHPDTALSLNNLGALLRSRGDLAGARPYCERALAILEKVLGADHPDTAFSLNNLGTLLRSQGDLARARSYYERALAIYKARLGPDHPYTRIVQEGLASLDAPPDEESPA